MYSIKLRIGADRLMPIQYFIDHSILVMLLKSSAIPKLVGWLFALFVYRLRFVEYFLWLSILLPDSGNDTPNEQRMEQKNWESNYSEATSETKRKKSHRPLSEMQLLEMSVKKKLFHQIHFDPKNIWFFRIETDRICNILLRYKNQLCVICMPSICESIVLQIFRSNQERQKKNIHHWTARNLN